MQNWKNNLNAGLAVITFIGQQATIMQPAFAQQGVQIIQGAAPTGTTNPLQIDANSTSALLNAINSAVPAGTNTIGGVFGTGTAGTAATGVFTVQGIANETPVQVALSASTATGFIAANNTAAVVVKASGGTLYGVQLYGIGSAPAYLKLYNATAATCGSGTPIKRLMIPAASTAAIGAGSNISFGDTGVSFSNGITYCVTTGITDADTTAPTATTFLVNLDYQ
jgi:hypothetical protein